MKNAHISENSDPNEDDPLILDILKAVFKHEGIEFESATFLRWQIVDDNILPRPIDTISTLFREFRDGTYQLAISNVKISVSGKKPFDIPWICIESTYSNGQWSEPGIFHDDETFDPANHETAQTLYARLQTVKQSVKAALEWIAKILVFAEAAAEAARKLFEGG